MAQVIDYKDSDMILSAKALKVLDRLGLLQEVEDRLLAYHMKDAVANDDFITREELSNGL